MFLVTLILLLIAYFPVKTTALVPPPPLPEVVVVGSTVVDLVGTTTALPKRGETVFGTTFAQNFGGKGSNQAVQVSRLGVRVSHVGQVGHDALGESYMAQLEKEGVDTAFMRRSDNGKATGIALINVEASTGANTIVVVPGANEDLTVDDAAAAAAVRRSKVLVTQNEVPRATTLKALQLAREVGNTVSIFNPAPVSADLADLVGTCDICVPNETELAALTSLPTATNGDVEVAAQRLLALGCRVVIATLGDKGAYVVAAGQPGAFFAAETVTAVDSTGAGDSFIGTLAACLARGAPLASAVRSALHCATRSVTRAGAQKSYATVDEVDEPLRPPPLGARPFNKDAALRL